jgi:hypothetical protein
VRAPLLLLVVASVCPGAGCKVDKQDQPQHKPAARQPGAPTPVEELQPELPNAKQLSVRTKTDAQITSIWCMDTAAGRDAVVQVADTLRTGGWTDVTTRGSADRFGVAATKGDVRLSATVGGRDEACTGTLVITTLARLAAPLHVPPTEDRVR